MEALTETTPHSTRHTHHPGRGGDGRGEEERGRGTLKQRNILMVVTPLVIARSGVVHNYFKLFNCERTRTHTYAHSSVHMHCMCACTTTQHSCKPDHTNEWYFPLETPSFKHFIDAPPDNWIVGCGQLVPQLTVGQTDC